MDRYPTGAVDQPQVRQAPSAIRAVGRLFTGPVRESMRNVPNLTRTEFAVAAVHTAGPIGFGIFPLTPWIGSPLPWRG